MFAKIYIHRRTFIKTCIKHGTSEKYVNVHIQSVKTYYTVTKTDHVAIVMFK